MDFKIDYYSLDNIFERVAIKLSKDEGRDRELLQIQILQDSWSAFIKWCKSQLDLERTLAITNFGNISYRKKENPGDKDKIIQIYINEQFLQQNGYKHRGNIEQSNYPPIKINFSAIQKLIPESNKIVIKMAIDNIFQEVIQILSQQNQNVQVDLGILGKLSLFEKTLNFEPLIFNKKSAVFSNKQTVKTLIDQRRKIGLNASMASLKNVQTSQDSWMFQPGVEQQVSNSTTNLKRLQGSATSKNLYSSQIVQSENQMLEGYAKKDFISPHQEKLMSYKRRPKVHHNPQFPDFSKVDKNMSSPSRRFKIENVQIDPELLAAGTDPLAKNQYFSKLANKAASLIDANFMKPPNSNIRFPPILDKFSRTLAAPLSAQKHNLSVSARIANNYTPTAKKLYFDNETKGIKILKLFETAVAFTANDELLREPADMYEELDYEVEGIRTQELIQKIEAKKTYYKRYRTYIEHEISVDFVAPIDHNWITDILELIPHQLQYVDGPTMTKMIDKMLNEINRDYYESVRKSILDYVLKDDDERKRIGLMTTFDEVKDYGENIYCGLEADDVWKEHVELARQEISQNLVICSRASLELMELWKKYEKMHFLVLPSKKDPIMTIGNFLQIQKKNVKEVKNHLVSEWHKDVIEIFKEELTQMNKNKRMAVLFFESNATLMSNQIRQLVTDSLVLYKEFFYRFKKDQLYDVNEIIEMEKDCRNPLEDAFLQVKLVPDEATQTTIIFQQDLNQIKENILDIIDLIVNVSRSFPRAENHIARSDKMSLWNIPDDDETYVNVKEEVREILDTNMENIKEVTSVYEKYAFLLQEKQKVQEWVESEQHGRKDYDKQLKQYQDLYNEVNKNIPFFVRMNMILIDGTEIKKQFLLICSEIEQSLQTQIHIYTMKRSADIQNDINKRLDELKGKAQTTDKLVELEQKKDEIKSKEHKRIKEEFGDLTKWVDMLLATTFTIQDKDLNDIYQTSKLVHGIMNEVETEEARIDKEREQLEKILKKRREEFVKNIEEYCRQIEGIPNEFQGKVLKDQAVVKMQQYREDYNTYVTEMLDINKEEGQLDWQITEFPELEDAGNKLKPFEQLWYLIRDKDDRMDQWKNQKQVFDLDPEQMEKDLKEMERTSAQLINLFGKHAKYNKPLKLGQDVKSELYEFKENIKLARVFSNKGLKARHWDEIYRLTGLEINPANKEIKWNLSKCITFDLHQKKDLLEQLEIISDSAQKEWSIEKILDKMQEEWEPIVCELKEWKTTQTYIVGGASNDEVQQILDDQIVKTLTMKGSPQAKIFEDRIQKWEVFLNYVQDLFEYWLKVQAVWIYLEPVMTAPDIKKKLPKEGEIFHKVDKQWREMMSSVKKTPKIMDFTKDKKMLDLLKNADVELEKVQKQLNLYLEEKRGVFPRFYFLGDSELLEILSETKDPERVQPFLKKCFEGIEKLKFLDAKPGANKEKIEGMFSSEKEYVKFNEIVDTATSFGNVDAWLLAVEEMMINSIKKAHEDGFNDHNKPGAVRTDWIINRCGMAVLCVNMIMWTSLTEAALKSDNNTAVPELVQRLENQLLDVVEKVRSPITPLDRCTVEALIVLDVHNKNVVRDLHQNKVNSVFDFGWTQQLRYYWDKDVSVNIINAIMKYNYEYLGNSTRLVITPLTDRCYRTLCGAVHLQYGGAPEGPAGTGKTETVKDLAKALARQCVVFNCSDGLDYKAMGKFFKGLAQSGAWSCFDEFNRIDLEVLSVVATQISTITEAKKQKKDSLMFEGSNIKLKATANSFITMNPGYAGRSELPDNLKALFRSVAMMVPDYAMISQIKLYSFGFTDAGNLARKIVTTYKLCSEQLSSQDHYDYGMRAVISVLVAAGNLKKKFPEQDESILMLRAINEVNLAKFLAFDLPLFRGITSDLFPGTKLPEQDYKDLFECIEEALSEKNLQKNDYILMKIIQIYEMVRVRHGLMVVGMPFSGKSVALHSLAKALGKLEERQKMNEFKTRITTVNPKSINMKLLYGFADEVSHEWTDGVLAVKYRQFARDTTTDRKWLLFDGPIDAVWIENMNTVLDDNKKLCLNSGEIIAMNNKMNIIFEPMDLAAASPATVSRCGMIYMEPASMGWRPMYKSWRNEFILGTLKLKPEDVEEVDLLFEWIIDPSLEYIKHNFHPISPSQNQNLVISLMRILNYMLIDYKDEAFYNSLEMKPRQQIIQSRFLFAFIWSLGGCLGTKDDRKKFDLFLKRLTALEYPVDEDVVTKKISNSLPERGTAYEYNFQIKDNKTEGEWVQWTDLIPPELIEDIHKSKNPQTLTIPTVDTVRYKFLLSNNVKQKVQTLFCGPTGTGKSIYTKDLLYSLPRKEYRILEIGFSAQTSSTQVQDIFDSNCERITKGVYGPKIGKMIIFIDDLNMPTKEKWGAQPPIELIRQIYDQGGYYDNRDKDKAFKTLDKVIFCSAMGPPGGGRTFVTPRILRHYSLISLTQFDDDTLNLIFSSILKTYMVNNNFSQEVIKCENKVIQSTNRMYKFAMDELLPTPAKSHYLFNLRDFSKVILGMCMADTEQITNMEDTIRLWVHESLRVFYDRLVNEEDRLKFLDYIRETVRKVFGSNFDTVFEHLIKEGNKELRTLDEIRGLMFTDVTSPIGLQKKPYKEIKDLEELQRACDEALENYNQMEDKPMDLVLFQFAIEHLLIICRILKSPGGNGLLVGVGGSGRQSLTNLGASMNEQKVKQIEITKQYGDVEWHEDLRDLLMTAGGKKTPSVFLFTDSQIKQESFVEDINNLLNTCEVPNLFGAEEKSKVMDLVRNDARLEGKAPEGTPEQLYSYFVEKCKANLHIVLAFSPIGDGFRQRVRMFPSLVNCCTIDWFFEWPQDALVSVARKFLQKIEMEKPEIRDSCTEMVQYFHESTIKWADQFYNTLGRKYYVTPTSYLEMIKTFQQLLAQKRKEVKDLIDKYENGYKQIINTESDVGVMQVNLTELVPKIQKSAEEAAEQAKVVAVEKEKADAMAEVISKEEATVQVDVDKAKAIEDEVNGELEKAMPALQAAEDALNKIDKKSIDFVKNLANPPEAIKVTMKAICLILFPNPGPEFKEKVGLKLEINWWKVSQKVLGNSKLIDDMKNFDKEHIPDNIIRSLEKYLNDPNNTEMLEEKSVTKASPEVWSMLCWATAMHKFYYVNKEVLPKKKNLEEAQKKVAELNKELSKKQALLKEATDKVNALNDSLNRTIKNKEDLEHSYNMNSLQLERAKQLIDSLGGEKGRWKELAEQLEVDYINLTGDVLVSSGMIAYLGAFTPSYRNDIAADWVIQTKKKEIPGSEKYSLQKILGDAVKIRQWNIDGLPSDNFSIENAIFASKSNRWPLFIDPQGQANKWIKKMEKYDQKDAHNKVKIIKLSDPNYMRDLENAILLGTPVLLENIQEEIDASLTPVLLKQLVTKGNSTYLKLGDKQIDYHKDFRFYITTKLRNPHYLPELSTKVILINFMITYEGLNDQLLGILVKEERPDLEKEKERLIVEGAANKKQLADIENKILQVLSGNQNILTDETAINILKDAKNTSNDINEKQVIAEQTEIEIDTARQKYQPVSQQASNLFFTITDLNNLDPMYQYSLVYFIDLFTQGILNSEKSDNLDKRLEILKEYFTYSLYSNICRSLFEKDKLVFSMLLTCRLLEFYGNLNNNHWRFLLTGGTVIIDNPPEKPKDTPWISEKAWGSVVKLSTEKEFNDKDNEFYKEFYDEENLKQFKVMYDSDEAHTIDLPAKVKAKYSSDFHYLMILRIIRPDKLIPAVHNFIVKKMGKKFLEPPPFDLQEIYKDSSVVSPLIFVLSPGSDPFQSLIAFGKKFHPDTKIENISLGQGQGKIAEGLIEKGQQEGNWVVLMNCHLAVSWMTTLERICESIPKETDKKFRLWLTSYPSPNFPTSVLQAGIKMTNEPPKGLRSNLQGSYYTTPIKDMEFFDKCEQPEKFKKLVYSLCFFHAVIQERRKYGPLGWNIPYEFNESDLRICVQQLKMFLDEFTGQEVPFSALKYLTAECNYGGRVTDDKDRRLIVTLLEQYYCQEALDNDEYSFFNNEEIFQIPKAIEHGEFIDCIKEKIPAIVKPGVFGFHPNADITKDMNETNFLCDSLLTCSAQGGGGGGGSDYEKLLNEVCSKILEEFPLPFDIEETKKKYPVLYEESMNTVLLQELTRFNRLIQVVRSSLADILKAIKGLLIMSPQLEAASKQIYDGKIPEMWLSSSYPSLKPLASYVKNLLERISFMQNWIDNGMPKIYWLSGFYFTQSYLTGVLQNFARKYTIPIDEIQFDFEMREKEPVNAAEDGAYVDGLFIEGAKFDYGEMKIVESDPKILYVDCPIIKLVPIRTDELNKNLESAKFYNSPVYKTSARRGTLSTTGHSTNFVMYIRLPSDQPQAHWIKRGVALLTQLDD